MSSRIDDEVVGSKLVRKVTQTSYEVTVPWSASAGEVETTVQHLLDYMREIGYKCSKGELDVRPTSTGIVFSAPGSTATLGRDYNPDVYSNIKWVK